MTTPNSTITEPGYVSTSEWPNLLWFGRYHHAESVVFGYGRFRTFRPGFGFGQRYHLDRHGQLALKQLRLSVLNEMHTNSYTGPRLPVTVDGFIKPGKSTYSVEF